MVLFPACLVIFMTNTRPFIYKWKIETVIFRQVLGYSVSFPCPFLRSRRVGGHHESDDGKARQSVESVSRWRSARFRGFHDFHLQPRLLSRREARRQHRSAKDTVSHFVTQHKNANHAERITPYEMHWSERLDGHWHSMHCYHYVLPWSLRGEHWEEMIPLANLHSYSEVNCTAR